VNSRTAAAAAATAFLLPRVGLLQLADDWIMFFEINGGYGSYGKQ
jgi:hypothetical protein